MNGMRRLLSLFVLAGGVAAAGAQGQASNRPDRQAIRLRAEQSPLSETERREIFAQLRPLVDDADATPTERCLDFYRAVTVLQKVAPAEAVQFAEATAAQEWVTAVSPKVRGLFACGLGSAYLADRQLDRAKRVLKGISPLERADSPFVEAVRADALLKVSIASGEFGEADTWRGVLWKALANPRLSPRVKAEFTFDVLHFLYDAGAPASQMQRIVQVADRLIPSARGEARERLQLLVDILRSQAEFSAPWPTEKRDADRRVLRLAEFAERMRTRSRELEGTYGATDPATILVMETIATMDLELAPFTQNGAELQGEALRFATALVAVARQEMLEPERLWFLKGLAAGMLGEETQAREAYGEIKSVQKRFAGGAGAGVRFNRRLLLLALFAERDPKFVAEEWPAACEDFGRELRQVGKTEPEVAVSMLDAWEPMTMFGALARHGDPAAFLRGAMTATRWTSTLPYLGRAKPGERDRFPDGLGLADIQRRLRPEHPLLVISAFRDPMPPNRNYYGAFLLDGGSVRFVDLGPLPPVQEALESWRKSLSTAGRSETEAARRLYELLLHPVFPVELPRYLSIVADPSLGRLSFSALRGSGDRWVVERCAVAYLGSMADLVRPASARAVRPSVLLRGDVVGAAKQSAVALRQVDPRLDIEAAKAANLADLRAPRFLHLSLGEAHDVADPLLDSGEAAQLLFSDRPVSFRRLATLDLAATRCVGLALRGPAIRAGVGESGWGEIRRAFSVAGARAVVGPLWGVSSATPGDRILSRIYAPIATGLWPAEALRQAQLTWLKENPTSPPSDWAAFICEGN